MVSRNRKIARRIGQAVANDVLDISGAISAGAGVTVYATVDDLPTTGLTAGDEAFISGSNRLYISNGTGWYSIGLINTNPSITSVQDPSANATPFTLATDGSALVLTITAADPEDVPLTYSYAVTTGSLTNGGGTTATVVQGTGANTNQFTITPTSTEAYAGTFELTFTASDGINQASSVNSFTLSFITIITNSNYTTLLATAVDTSDNNNITDASSNTHTITVNGDAHAGTFSPYRSGGYLTKVTVNDGFTFADHADFQFGTGEFTIDFWYKKTIDQSGFGVILRSSNGQFMLAMYQNKMSFHNGTNVQVQSATLDLGEWYHVAITRNSSNNVYIWLNGVPSTTWNAGTQNFNASGTWELLHRGSFSESVTGEFSNFRIVKGTCLYTSNFSSSLPIERTVSVSGSGYSTSLLMNDIMAIDDGPTAHSLTAVGSPKSIPSSPYDYNEYAAADHGGSVYFDTSDDYLTVPNGSWKTYGSSNFTIECWFYADRDGMLWGDSSTSGLGDNCTVIADLKEFNGANAWVQVEFRVGSTKYGINPAQGTFKRNTWNHIAFVRNGNTFTVYSNGKDVGNTSQSGSMNTSSNDWAIASAWPSTTGTQFNGYISDFRVSKSARYTAEFTPPTAPLSSTGAELHIKGTDASIINKSQGANLKLFGNTTGSTTQAKFSNTKSMYFGGETSGDYIQVTSTDEQLNLGKDPFTIEAWVFPNGAIGNNTVLSGGQSSTNRFDITGLLSTGLRFFVNSTVSCDEDFTEPSANVWSHIAFVRNGTSLSFYINGTLDRTATISADLSLDMLSYYLLIGERGHLQNLAISDCWDGYIQDLRITKGLARYTANFTPPTAPLEG